MPMSLLAGSPLAPSPLRLVCHLAKTCLLVLLMATPSPAILAQPSEPLLETAQRWLDTQKPSSGVIRQVLPLDARVVVPACAQPFNFSVASEDGRSILARCPSSDWSLYLQVEHQEASGPIFAQSLPKGHLLVASDILFSSAADGTGPREKYVGRFLRSPVRMGQRLSESMLEDGVSVFVLRESVPAQMLLWSGLFSSELRPASAQPASRLVTLPMLEGSRSTRALLAGTVVLASDIAPRHAVITAAETLPRGTMVSPRNTVLGYHWGRLPVDAVTETSALPRAYTTSTVTAGTPLRLSMLRVVAPVAKGEVVSLQVRRGMVEVVQQMRALQDGQVGQQIDLLNEESGETVRGEVTGIGLARVP